MPASVIPDGAGGTFDISQPASAEVLASLKKEFQAGEGLAWYFLPKEERYRQGPGLTGDEVLNDLKSGRFVEDGKHVDFIYGFYTQNVTKLYRLYRASGDPWYLDQIVKYAEGIEWLLENQPQRLLPLERRGASPKDPVSTIPHEPAALANFWAPVNAARLLLERAKEARLPANDSTVLKAKRLLGLSVQYMASQITADYKDLPLRRGEAPVPFEPGVRTLELRENFGIPARAAQVIEYTPWNQTFFYFAVLAGATRALEDLQEIEGGIAYQSYIELYRNVVKAGMWSLQNENICVVREGVPYFFHMHTPLRDKEVKSRLGFPMFSGEDVSHSTSGTWNLPYIWEAGEDFGVTPALLAGYANAMLLSLREAAMTDKKGNPVPRMHLDSPWYLAASGRENFPWSGMKGRYYALMPFCPEIVAANRPWSRNNNIWENPGELNRLYASYLYRLWMERCE
ncbi:MAG: hypothetical protein AAGA58_17975 [Verrucomicrobiota bacterium]